MKGATKAAADPTSTTLQLVYMLVRARLSRSERDELLDTARRDRRDAFVAARYDRRHAESDA